MPATSQASKTDFLNQQIDVLRAYVPREGYEILKEIQKTSDSAAQAWRDPA